MADEEIKTAPVAEAQATIQEVAPAAIETPTILGTDPKVSPEQPELKLETEKSSEIIKDPAAVEKPAEPKAEEKPLEAKKEEPVKKEEVKVEAKTEEKPVDAKIEDKPVELPKFEPFVLPEGAKLEDNRISEIQSMLGNFEVAAKADHAQVQKFGQAMVEYGIAAVKEAVDAVQKQANEYWSKKHKEDLEAFERDPEIGGNRKDTTVAAANQFIRTHLGNDEQQKAFRALLVERKLDNNPIMIRALANANLARAEGRPLPGTKPVPAPTSKLDKWYGNGAR